ncbi:MAG: oligogalacturonate lyase family protein [Gemmatimonadota bacterium]|nr:oligogalacturonate lyase family protein [Gemmatimonadota bacterium]
MYGQKVFPLRRGLFLAGSLFLLLFMFVNTALGQGKGAVYPSEMKRIVAPESGLSVIQFTTAESEDFHPYFTNNDFSLDSRHIVFMSNRTGEWNIFYGDLETGRFTQITDCQDLWEFSTCFAPGKGEIYFTDSQVVKAISIQDYRERELFTIPEGFNSSVLSLTSDEKYLVFCYNQELELKTETGVIYSSMREKWEKRPWSVIVSVATDGSGATEVLREKVWISHVQTSPTDPGLVLYCHEGPWKLVPQRLWLIRTDGTGKRKLRIEEKPEVRIGHEFFYNDGIHAGYHGGDSRGEFFGMIDVNTNARLEIPVQISDRHLHGSSDGLTLVGDGTTGEPYFTIYRLEGMNLKPRRVFRHGSKFDRQIAHPHPRFSPDDRKISFTSDNGGDCNVYVLLLE